MSYAAHTYCKVTNHFTHLEIPSCVQDLSYVPKNPYPLLRFTLLLGDMRMHSQWANVFPKNAHFLLSVIIPSHSTVDNISAAFLPILWHQTNHCCVLPTYNSHPNPQPHRAWIPENCYILNHKLYDYFLSQSLIVHQIFNVAYFLNKNNCPA